LKKIAEKHKKYIPKGIDIKALDREKLWEYEPTPTIKVGSRVCKGQVIGTVQNWRKEQKMKMDYDEESKEDAEPTSGRLVVQHKIMVPPLRCYDDLMKVTWIIKAGEYTIEECVMKLENSKGEEVKLVMYH